MAGGGLTIRKHCFLIQNSHCKSVYEIILANFCLLCGERTFSGEPKQAKIWYCLLSLLWEMREAAISKVSLYTCNINTHIINQYLNNSYHNVAFQNFSVCFLLSSRLVPPETLSCHLHISDNRKWSVVFIAHLFMYTGHIHCTDAYYMFLDGCGVAKPEFTWPFFCQ